MKIELKKVEFSERLSEETNCFAANLYINDVFAGVASNQGHGGPTGYTADNPKGEELIKEAEAWCSSLPPERWESGGEQHELNMNLELYIDTLLEDHLKQKDIQKIRNKVAKTSVKSIVVGVPDNNEFTYYPYKHPIAAILKYPNGKQLLADSIHSRIKSKIEKGEMILNTNIPEEVLKAAKLSPDQYVKPAEGLSQVQKQKPPKKTQRRI